MKLSRCPIIAIVLSASTLLPNIAVAADKYFSCANGDVSDASCWVGGVLPVSTDINAYIGKASIQTANLSSGSFSSYIAYLGYSSGIGTFTQAGGTHTNTSLRLGFDGTGYYNLNDGTLTSTYEYINMGTFTQTGGTNSAPIAFAVGQNSSKQGIYNLSAGSLNAPYSAIGNQGTGTFNQTGGTYTATSLTLGSSTGGKGYYNLSAGILSSSTESIGNYGTGNFTQTGGTNTTTSLNMGGYASSGVYNLNNGTLNVGNITRLAVSGQSTLNINGGLLNWTGNSIVVNNLNIGSASSSNNSLTLENGKTIDASAIMVSSGNTFNFNGGTLAVKNFAGNLTNNGGILAPGSTSPILTHIGVTNVAGNYAQNSLSTYSVGIGGLLAGIEYDVLKVGGTATLDGTLSFTLTNNNLFKVGDSFDILTAQNISGTFGSLLFSGDPAYHWDTLYLKDVIGTTDVVRLTITGAPDITPIPTPLPSALWLLGSGLLGLIGVARRKAA